MPLCQDLGVVSLMRRVAPHLPVHGSTQMTITSAQGAEFALQLGVDRVVVGRELSVKEIAKVWGTMRVQGVWGWGSMRRVVCQYACAASQSARHRQGDSHQMAHQSAYPQTTHGTEVTQDLQ